MYSIPTVAEQYGSDSLHPESVTAESSKLHVRKFIIGNRLYGRELQILPYFKSYVTKAKRVLRLT